MITRHGLLAGAAVTLAALLTFSAAGSAAASTGHVPAGHSTVPARTSGAISAGDIECNGDACVQNIGSDGPGVVKLHVWANTYGFRGHFELSYGCSIGGCTTQNSINTYWHAGGSGWIFSGVSCGVSGYAYAWKGGPPWTKIGAAGWSTFYTGC
jgi:hypothetical protein